MSETWKPISGFPLYEVSDLGRVKRIKGGPNTFAGRILKHKTNRHGYSQLCLCRNGKIVSSVVHQLVARAFITPDEHRPVVNHKNGIKSDNRLENLEWATRSENTTHAYRTGLLDACTGANHHLSKLTDDAVRDCRIRSRAGQTYKVIANALGVSTSTVCNIVTRRTWKHVV